MNEPAPLRAGDRVTVVGHPTWDGWDPVGHPGTVAHVEADGQCRGDTTLDAPGQAPPPPGPPAPAGPTD